MPVAYVLVTFTTWKMKLSIQGFIQHDQVKTTHYISMPDCISLRSAWTPFRLSPWGVALRLVGRCTLQIIENWLSNSETCVLGERNAKILKTPAITENLNKSCLFALNNANMQKDQFALAVSTAHGPYSMSPSFEAVGRKYQPRHKARSHSRADAKLDKSVQFTRAKIQPLMWKQAAQICNKQLCRCTII